MKRIARFCLVWLSVLFLLAAAACSRTGEFTGLVTGPNGGPVAGATVRATGTVASATTGRGGDYTLEMEPGTWSLTYSAPGYASRTLQVEFADKKGGPLPPVRLWPVPETPGAWTPGGAPYRELSPVVMTEDGRGLVRLGANVAPLAAPRVVLSGEDMVGASHELFALELSAPAAGDGEEPDRAVARVYVPRRRVDLPVLPMKADSPFAVLALPEGGPGFYLLRVGQAAYSLVVAGPDMAPAYRTDPWDALARGDVETALETANLRLRFEPESAPLALLAGTAARLVQNAPEAKTRLTRALELGLAPEDAADAHGQLAEIARRRGDREAYVRHVLARDRILLPGVARGFVALLCEVRTSDGMSATGVTFSVGDRPAEAWNPGARDRDLVFPVDAGDVSVRFDKYGYEPAVMHVEVLPGRVAEVTDTVVLTRRETPPAMVRASGRVADAQGNGLAGAEVSFFHRPAGPGFTVTSDAAGNYSASNLPAGEYVIGYNRPLYTRSEAFAELAEPAAELPTAVLVPLRRVSVTWDLVDGRTGAVTRHEAELACTHQNEPSNGLDLVTGEVKGDWTPRGEGLHVYVTQAGGLVGMNTADGTLGAAKRLPPDHLEAALAAGRFRALRDEPVSPGSVFTLSVDRGRWFAVLEVTGIVER